MQDLLEKYKIPPVFFQRYFREGAEMVFAVRLQEFLLFQRGKFLSPAHRNAQLEEIICERIIDFYEHNRIDIPKIDFDITTRCTLNCRFCSNMTPLFSDYAKQHGNMHRDMSFDTFKLNMDAILDAIDGIGVLHFMGGEPLLHRSLPQMLEYACDSPKVKLVKIITNGTIIPSAQLLAILARYRSKVVVFISNYTANPELALVLKHKMICDVLQENGVKYQIPASFMWKQDAPLRKAACSIADAQMNFARCYMASCISVFERGLHICGKSSRGFAMGVITSNDFVDLRQKNSLREKIVSFYEKNYFNVCRHCVRSDKEVIPAQQR